MNQVMQFRERRHRGIIFDSLELKSREKVDWREPSDSTSIDLMKRESNIGWSFCFNLFCVLREVVDVSCILNIFADC